MPTELQLYLWSGARAIFLDRHTFYVTQLKSRLLAQFDDLEQEADRFAEESFARMGRVVSYGETDPAEFAEAAYDEAVEHYLALVELRKQVLLGGLAGMYHQFDKQLREFIERELQHEVEPSWMERNLWAPPGDRVLDILEAFGWPVRSLPFYPQIEALQLVVNVYKHGKGRSLKELSEKYPDYVVDPVRAAGFGHWRTALDHEWLTVTDVQLDAFAAAIRDFWQAMPERLTFEVR